MSLRITSLGSGSKGNATLIQFRDEAIIIDSGFSCRTLEARLKERGISPESVNAILVTHEHSDHFKGVATFSNKYSCPCWLSRGTSLHHLAEKLRSQNIFCNHTSFDIGSFKINPVAVPHDAREACQFVVSAGAFKVGLLTDLGHITSHIKAEYRELDALLIEFNHDYELLMQGSYPPKLKARVGGALGHLNNDQSFNFLQELDYDRLQLIAAMHLSEENNCKVKVKELLSRISSKANLSCIIADQEKGFDWVELLEEKV